TAVIVGDPIAVFVVLAGLARVRALADREIGMRGRDHDASFWEPFECGGAPRAAPAGSTACTRTPLPLAGGWSRIWKRSWTRPRLIRSPCSRDWPDSTATGE